MTMFVHSEAEKRNQLI